MYLNLNLENNNVLLSGGANGSDLLWGYCAGMNGHTVIHWCFEDFKSYAPECEVVRLKKEHLEYADEYLKMANEKLKRKLDFNFKYINLLRRNLYQILYSDKVYAISSLDNKGNVKGGTAWAVQMFIDKVNNNNLQDHTIYLFETTNQFWLTYDFQNKNWNYLNEKPPKPKGIWTGIGTRTTNKYIKNEIKDLMDINYEK